MSNDGKGVLRARPGSPLDLNRILSHFKAVLLLPEEIEELEARLLDVPPAEEEPAPQLLYLLVLLISARLHIIEKGQVCLAK